MRTYSESKETISKSEIKPIKVVGATNHNGWSKLYLEAPGVEDRHLKVEARTGGPLSDRALFLSSAGPGFRWEIIDDSTGCQCLVLVCIDEDTDTGQEGC